MRLGTRGVRRNSPRVAIVQNYKITKFTRITNMTRVKMYRLRCTNESVSFNVYFVTLQPCLRVSAIYYIRHSFFGNNLLQYEVDTLPTPWGLLM